MRQESNGSKRGTVGKIIVTGASGAFGSAAAKLLLKRCAPQDLIFLTRTPDKLKHFSRRAPMCAPQTLTIPPRCARPWRAAKGCC
jgi:NADP-dependent 3-hydroxy acid dehydrogenase YdfG